MNFFDIYMGVTDGFPDDWTMISSSELVDVLARCVKIDKVLAKPNISVEPVTLIKSPDGTEFAVGEYVKISFDSKFVNTEEYEFLRSMTENKVMVIYYDPNNNSIIYGVKNAKVNLHPITNIDGKQLITYFGQTMEDIYLYTIGLNMVRINYPRHGFIYNKTIDIVSGYIS